MSQIGNSSILAEVQISCWDLVDSNLGKKVGNDLKSQWKMLGLSLASSGELSLTQSTGSSSPSKMSSVLFI